jgi:hypothetical protein
MEATAVACLVGVFASTTKPATGRPPMRGLFHSVTQQAPGTGHGSRTRKNCQSPFSTQYYTTGKKVCAPIPSYLKTAAIFAVVWYIIVSQQRHRTTAVRWPMWLTRGFEVHAAGVRNWTRLLQFPARAP